MKNLAFILIFLLNINTFAQTQNWQAAQISEFSQKISEVTKNQIWNEFDAMKYFSFQTEKDEKFIKFMSVSEKPENSFFWKTTEEYFLQNPLEHNLSHTFHESFHAFESDEKRAGNKWRRENSMLVFEYQESSARNNALFNIEGKILYSALQTKNINQLKEKVRQFLAARNLRYSEIDSRFTEFEKGAESNEGMAEYAGTKAVVLAIQANKQLSLNFNYPNAVAFLAKKYDQLNSITKIGKNIRLKFYFTGSVQGFLLDRLMKDWKTKVQMESKAVQDLLAESVGKNDSKTDKILAQYGYEKILAEEEKSVAKRTADNQALLDNTLNQKGRKYLINYAQLKRWTGIGNFDPMNVTMVAPKIRVHTRSVSFASENSFTAVFSQPVVEDLEKKQYTTFVAEEENMVADGKVIDLTKNSEFNFKNNLVIKSANFTLEATSGNVKISNREILITFY